MKDKPLIVYYSWSETVAQIAGEVQRQVGGDILRLYPETPYPDDYQECVEQAKKEVPGKFTPKLKPFDLDLGKYDSIFVGSPNWCGSFAPPTRTFLTSFDLTGKVIYPFCSHGGGGQRNFTADVLSVCAKAMVKDTLVLAGTGGRNLTQIIRQCIQETGKPKNTPHRSANSCDLCPGFG